MTRAEAEVARLANIILFPDRYDFYMAKRNASGTKRSKVAVERKPDEAQPATLKRKSEEMEDAPLKKEEVREDDVGSPERKRKPEMKREEVKKEEVEKAEVKNEEVKREEVKKEEEKS